MTYIPGAQQTVGNKIEATVSDDNAQHLLNAILKEMKKMNLHMSLVTDNTITNQEVE